MGRSITPNEDKLAALRQLPAPIFALDTAHTVLCIMAKSVVLIETNSKEVLTMVIILVKIFYRSVIILTATDFNSFSLLYRLKYLLFLLDRISGPPFYRITISQCAIQLFN